MEEDDRESYTGRASADRARPGSAGRVLSTGTGAVTAAAVLAALGGWLWHIGVRDAQQVPIIRASNAPVKVRPADPGGEVTPYQEIGSYDIGAGRETPPPAARLAPPPPEPTEEDAAMGALKTPDPRPAPEPGAPVLRPAPAPPSTVSRTVPNPVPQRTVPHPVPRPATLSEAANDARPAPPPPPAPARAVPGTSPFPRPDNLRIRTLAARANAETGDHQ